MKRLYKILFIFLFSISLKAFSQEPSLKNYDLNKGLPSNECYKVIQDKKGYIWIASDGGLSRYNGYIFQNFTKKDGLPDNVIIHLFEDSRGRIWVVGLNTRIAYFENENFYPVKELNQYLEKNVKKAFVSSVFVSDKDEVEMGFNVFHPYHITHSLLKKTTAEHKIQPSIFFIRTGNNSNFIFAGSNVMLSYNHGLYFNIEQDKKPPVSIYVDCENRPSFIRYLRINDNSFLLSLDQKLFKITGTEISEVLNLNTNILFLFKDKANRVWVLPQNDGAYVFDATTIHKENGRHLFEGYSFSSITQDNELNYWVTSLKNGVYQIPNFDIIHCKFKEQNEIGKMNVVEKYNNHIYVGGFSKYIYTLDNEKLKKEFELSNKNAEVFDMKNCNNKALVMVGTSSYLARINEGKIKVEEIRNPDRIGAPAYLRYLDCGKLNKDIIYSGTSIGAAEVDLNTASRVPFKNLPPSTLNTVYTDVSTNRVYVACANGLYYTCDNFNSYKKIEDSLLYTRINHIAKKHDTLILCSKERGLLFWDGKKSWAVDVSNGLASNECRKAILDKQGNIWVSTNKGLSKIETANKKLTINNLTENEGLTGNDVNNFSIIDNEVWLPNANGVTKFSTLINITHESKIPIYITSITIDDSLYKVNSFSEIPYNHNYIKINFNGLCYKNNENIIYQYRLSGLDTSWKKTKNTQVQFTKLAAGNYLFEIRVIKNNQIKSLQNTEFGFVIYPPWYKTWWFILFSFISITALIYLFFLFRFKRFKAREEEKTRLITLVTETEIKALRAQTKPHFIFNALNSIRLFILKNDSEQAQFYLMQFAQLMRDVLENSEHDVIDLNKEFSILKTYIELESLRFSKKFKFEINIPDEIANAKILIPPLLLQPIIENALWHGLMPLEDREGVILLKVIKNNNTVIITIEDNGIGRKKSAEIKMGKSNHKTSKGISITTNRIDLFNKKHKEQIKIITTDLEVGTRVELIINNV